MLGQIIHNSIKQLEIKKNALSLKRERQSFGVRQRILHPDIAEIQSPRQRGIIVQVKRSVERPVYLFIYYM